MPGRYERGRVWVLEDSPLEAEMARRALGATQEVEVFSDGSVVLESVAGGGPVPDVIVLDWQLPGISGVEVCRVIRATHEAMSLPILMLTGQSSKDDVVEALSAGANDYVVKPYDMAELIARVGTLVRTSRLQRAQVRRSQQLALSSEIGEAITKEKSIEEVAKRCTLALAKHLDAPSTEIWADRDGELRLLASTGHSASPNPSSAVPEPVVRRVAESQKPIVTDDPTELTTVHSCGRGAAGFAALPLVVRDETHGVLVFCSATPIGDALPALETIADLLALGIARARADDDRSRSLEAERTARAEAQAANRSKDDFLAMVSHELRTPLNAITGWTNMLLGGTLDPTRVTRALHTIERNARSQAQIIDDLLDVSRIVSGELRIDASLVDVPAVAELALETVRLSAETKGLTVDSQIDLAAGSVTGDADRIQQIIWNLISNAIKFTPKGGSVGLCVRRRGETLAIEVTDSGQGIAPDFLPHVFERFKQADGTITRTKGGLGLGLAIVQNLVELHGGTIEAKSAGLGLGATFIVVLPTHRVEAPPSSLRPSRLSPRSHALAGLRVLVVDDEPDALELVRALLEDCQVAVITATNAADAFAIVTAKKVDAMVSDIAMPDEDGLSLIHRIRSLPEASGGRTPAVALTAYARLEDRKRALAAGFDSHVAKPLHVEELLTALASFKAR